MRAVKRSSWGDPRGRPVGVSPCGGMVCGGVVYAVPLRLSLLDHTIVLWVGINRE